MKLGSDTLTAHLARQLLPAYLVSGDEPLLAGEAADAIRDAARKAGFTERQVFFAERGFDWAALTAASQSLSLFAERRILEVKLPSGKPGNGADVLESLIAQPAPDQVLLVTTGQLDRTAQQAGWVKAMERLGGWVTVWPIEITRLPQWISERMKKNGLTIEPAAARFLAERVEGNLLAARQEIEKLALLLGSGNVDLATLEESVARSARYDVFKLQDATLRGDAERALRILSGLRSEGEEATYVLWALSSALRAVWNSLRGLQAVPVWQRPPAGLSDAVRRLKLPAVTQLLGEATEVDRAIKGRLIADPWDGLERLVAGFAGIRLSAAVHSR